MLPEQKIWRLSETESQSLLPSGQQVVLCYGHFNIIHPGHIRFLEHAKSLGQQLIVAVQGDQMLTHSGNSHLFSAQERAIGLAWLQIVDGVLILDRGDLAEVIQVLRPNLLVVGKNKCIWRDRFQLRYPKKMEICLSTHRAKIHRKDKNS